jgi:exodeoxyribonuclease-3
MDLLTDWLQRRQPDVVCLQETKVVDELFPVAPIADLGYSAAFTGERTYNGVAILSRGPLSDIRMEFPLETNADRRLISGVYEGVRVYCAYFPNGRDPASEHFQIKLRWIDALGDIIFRDAGSSASEPTVLLGDFNIAPEPRDVFSVEAMEGRIHFTLEERATLQRLLDRGFVDAFRLIRQEPGIYSWWDYRMNMFKRKLGLRIDHTWVTPQLAPKTVDAYVDVEERAREHASDHAPVLIELDV